MRKVFIFFLIALLASSFAAAKDIAYVVKTSSNSNIVSILSSLNYSYDIITDSQIPATDFSSYAVILVQDSVANRNIIPLNSKNGIFLDKNLVASVWGSSWGVFSTTGAYAQIKQIASPFTDGFSIGQFNAYSASKTQNYLKRTSTGGSNTYGVAYPTGESSQLYPVVSYSNSGTRKVFFGFSDVSYWSDSTKKLFTNSLKWTRTGVDFDGDGYYSDSDCNDDDAEKWQLISGYADGDGDGYGIGSSVQVCSGDNLPAGYASVAGDCNDNGAEINPSATEIAYDYIDNNCDGYDLADVDNDGYCLKDYLIQDLFVQCINEAGGGGTDCDDDNLNINPGAAEIINNIDENCVNDAPFLTSDIPDLSWNEDEEDSIDLSNYFADYEGDDLDYGIVGNVNINSGISNVIATLSPVADWFGVEHVIFMASDGSLNAESNDLTLEVLPINDAPILNNIEDVYVVEGQLVKITPTATDADSEILDFSFSSPLNADGEWQTEMGDAGEYNADVIVSDGSLIDSKQVKITVLQKLVINEFVSNPDSGDEWVEIYNPGNSEFDLTGCYLEDAAYNHMQLQGIIAADSFLIKGMSNKLNNDGDTIKLKCSELLDEVAYGSGQVDIPAQGKSAGRISDGYDIDDVSDWKIYELPTKGISNSADMTLPVVSLILPLNNAEIRSDYVLFNYTASDDSADLINCSFYSDVRDGEFKLLASEIVDGGSENSFHATNAENGEYMWQIKCSDGSNIGESEIWNFKVNIPEAPVMQAISNITINETEIARIIINATDSNPEDTLNYYVTNSGKTNFIQDLTDNKLFSWNTGYGDDGVYYVNVSVTDETFVTEQIVRVTVNNNNRNPSLSEIAGITINEDENKTITLAASDEDEDNLIFSIKQKDASKIDCEISGNNLVILPALNWNGDSSCEIQVSDGTLSDTKQVDITVLPINDAPVLNSVADINVQEGRDVRIVLNASDVDSANLEYSVNDSRYEQDVDNNIFTLAGGYDAGTYFITASVSDNIDTDSETLKIIATMNHEPVIDSYSPLYNPVIAEDGSQTFNINWHDTDNLQSEVKVEWFADGNKTGEGTSYLYNADGKNAEIKVKVSDLKDYAEHSWNLETSTIPVTRLYDGETTSFLGMGDAELQDTNLTLEKTGKGKIEFSGVDLRDAVDFDNYADIMTGLTAIDTNYFTTLAGKLARVTLYGLGFDKTPPIYYNSGFTLNAGEIALPCPDSVCSNINYTNGTLSFFAHFTSFKIGEILSCSQQQGQVCSESEICSGTSVSAIEDNCCLGTCSYKFSDADRCENLSSEIEIEIKSPDEGDKFSIDEKIPLEIKVLNDYEDDLDFDVEIYLYDLTTDERVDEYSESLSVDSGKRETLELDITIPNGIDENDDFAVFVKVDEGDFCNENFVRIELERGKHDLIVSNFDIPDSANCGSDIEAVVGLENIGKEDENVELIISSSALGISDRSGFNLDSYDGEKNSKKANFIIAIPDYAEEKSYMFEASARFSGQTETVKKEVYVSCDKKKQEIQQDAGFIRLNSQVARQETSKISAFDSLNNKINMMDMTDLLVIVVDIFLALGIIFIIIYLLLRI